MRALTTLLVLLTALLHATAVSAEVFVVVSKSSHIEHLDEQEVRNIFLAKTNRLTDGSKVTPLMLSDQKTESNFYYRISGKNPSQINAYWMTLILTGKGKPPKEFADWKKLQEELTNNNGAIAFVPTEQLSDQMKVVYTLQ